MKTKNYWVKYQNGTTSGPYTREEAFQLMTMKRGELIREDSGWKGCLPTIVIILLVASGAILWLCS